MKDLNLLADILLSAAAAGSEMMREQRLTAGIQFKDLPEQPRTARTLAQCMVTSVDLAVQECVLRRLLDAGLGDFDLMAEESTESVKEFRGNSSNTGTLFLDPIDGTLTFALGCPSFEAGAKEAGFSEEVILRVRGQRDPRLYGLVLGAEIPNNGIVSVCTLPELGIVYHAVNDRAYRQRELVIPVRSSGSRCWVISSSILDRPDAESILSRIQSVSIRRSGSNPAALWYVLEGICSGYAAVRKPFDGQLAAVIARAAGLVVTGTGGNEFKGTRLRQTEESLVWAYDLPEVERLSHLIALLN